MTMSLSLQQIFPPALISQLEQYVAQLVNQAVATQMERLGPYDMRGICKRLTVGETTIRQWEADGFLLRLAESSRPLFTEEEAVACQRRLAGAAARIIRKATAKPVRAGKKKQAG